MLGSGYALCQLAWLGDAFHVSPEGECVMLMGRTLLERLAEAKAEWLLCRRARDLALLGEEGALELAALAFALYAADRHSGNMVVQVGAGLAGASQVAVARRRGRSVGGCSCANGDARSNASCTSRGNERVRE